jgi:hypothetical protein
MSNEKSHAIPNDSVNSRIREDVMLREWRPMISIVAALLLLAAPMSVPTQSSHPKGDTYEWSGEFASVDSAASTLTVKSRIAYQEAVSELKQFKPGAKVWVVWSGIRDYGDAVRQVRPISAGDKFAEDLVLPAELVSTDAPNQYLTIRVKVPEASLAAAKDVKPGEWVTVTSRPRPSTEAEAVVEVKPYGSATN